MTTYVSAKTPDADSSQQQHEAKADVSPWSNKYRHAGKLAQFAIFGSIFLYVYGQFAYFTDVYINTTGTFKVWWGVPADTPKGSTVGYSEMVRPTYFFFFAVLPVLVSVLLIEYLRHFNLRRVTGHYMLKFALVLRRKPRVFGKVLAWSYGEWIFFLSIMLGNIFVFYRFYVPRIDRMKSRATDGSLKFKDYLKAIGLTFGFVCIFNMAFLFLPATRNCVWMEVFNISYANGIKYHRWLGVVTVFTAIFHCIACYWAWIREGTWMDQALPCFNCDIAAREGYKKWFNVFGELALLVFLFIGVTSIPVVRRKLYNVFYYVHQLFILGVIFAIMHWAPIIWWVLPTFLIYCFSRSVSMANALSPVEVKELTAIANDLVKVVIHHSPDRDGHYKVGQFLYLNVPAISKLQWHAFTIASSPRSSPTTVTVLLKSLGDWTDELVTYANDCKATNVLPTVYADGYYGASLEMYDEYSTICLVGGGIGATPLFSILEDLAAKLSTNETISQKVIFIFSFRELALLEEIHPVLLRLKELDPMEHYFKMHLFLTRLPRDDVLDQRIDTERLLDRRPQPTKYIDSNAKMMPFYEPLRSRSYKALAMVTVLVVGLMLVVYLEFGKGKIKRANGQLWPLQQAVEALSMVVAAAAIVFLYTLAERVSKRKNNGGSCCAKDVESVFQAVSTPALVSGADVHTYRDLLSHYGVVQGERPNTKALFKEVHAFHNDSSAISYGKPVIGVFVSGLGAMKSAVEYAVADIGSHIFDIHEEEFEM